MCYVIFRNMTVVFIQETLLPSMNVKLDRPLGCYMLGRFLIQQSTDLNAVCGTLAALANLLWPYFQWARPHKMTTPYFLMFTSRDLTNYYAILETERYVETVNRHRDSAPGELSSVDSKIDRSFRVENREDKLKEMFMDQIMCYKVPSGSKRRFALRLRPNRSREANRNLRQLTADFTYYFSIPLSLSVLVILVIVFIELFDDRRYVTEYPSCDPELESELITHGVQSYTVTMTPNRLVAFVFDVVENLMLWIELGTIAYGIGFASILNYDLVSYWAYLHNKTEKLKIQAQLLRLDRSIVDSEQNERFPYCSTSDAVYPKAKELFIREHTHYDGMKSLHRELNENVRTLLHETYDFIQEISRIDLFLSDIISVSLCLWIAIFSSYVYLAPSLAQATDKPQSASFYGNANLQNDSYQQAGWKDAYILIVPMILIGVVFLALLTLHRNCLRTYPLLCALMAHHESVEKREFIPILDCFIEHRTCYRLFRMNPFKPITFLSFVGWSFSCFFIIRSLVRCQP